MKKQIIIISIVSIALLAILFSLSSFIRIPPKKRIIDDKWDENMQYNAENKQLANNQSITLSTAFYNDYYTNTKTQSSFYAELNANEKYSNNNSEKVNRIPLNIAIVLDRSGSMAGEKINNVKKAAKFIVDNTNENDIVSIIVYDNEVTVLQEATVNKNKQMLKNKIDAVQDRGGTNLAGGMQKGYQQVLRNVKRGYINRVLLLSDGLANEGITNPAEIEKIVQFENQKNGISISTFGVGTDYNENLMTAMAENSTGNYYFINNAEDIVGIFNKELQGLKNAVALNSNLIISIPENVNIQKIYGYNYDQIGRKLTIHLRDIFANETKGILIKFTIDRNSNTPIKFYTELKYTDADTKYETTLNTVNKQEFTTDYNTYSSHFSEWVEGKLTQLESNERLEAAMQETDKGNYKKAKQMIDENKHFLSAKPTSIQQLPAVQKVSTATTGYAEDMKDVESKSEAAVRFIQKSNKNNSYLIRNNKK